MSTLRSKIRNILIALFIGVWLVSAFHLAKQHFALNRSSAAVDSEMVSSTSGNIENYSVLITSVVGVIHYIYKR